MIPGEAGTEAPFGGLSKAVKKPRMPCGGGRLRAELAGPKRPLDVLEAARNGAEPSRLWFSTMLACQSNARTADGDTALHLAAERGLRKLARLLVMYGADPDALDAQGRRPSERTADPIVARLIDGGRGGGERKKHVGHS